MSSDASESRRLQSAEIWALNEADMPADLSPIHRFFVDFGRRRYRDLLDLRAMLIKVRESKTETEFTSWLAVNVVAPGNREEAELAMRGAGGELKA